MKKGLAGHREEGAAQDGPRERRCAPAEWSTARLERKGRAGAGVDCRRWIQIRSGHGEQGQREREGAAPEEGKGRRLRKKGRGGGDRSCAGRRGGSARAPPPICLVSYGRRTMVARWIQALACGMLMLCL